jgi:SNF2 family DNA or RNA helicase
MAIEHPIAKNSREYQVRYCNARLVEFRVKNVKDGTYEQRTVWKNDESSNLPELHEKIKPVLLRRMKNECLDLPPKIRSFIETDLDANEKAKYDQVFREMRERYHQRLRNNEIDGTADTLVMINNLRRAGSIAKINTAIALADEVLEQGGQVIIFTEFLDSARAIAAHYGTKPLEGSLSMGGRDKLVEDFQSGKTKVFVGMGGAGGVGLNLFKGQTVILVDRPWSPDVFQLEDRAHRIGQTGTVNCLWIQYGKMDDMIDETILWKFSNTSEILHGKPSTIPFVNNVQFSKELASKLFA